MNSVMLIETHLYELGDAETYLYELGDAGEELRSDLDGSEEGALSVLVNAVLTRVVPVEVHH